jgi:hypothetical protein
MLIRLLILAAVSATLWNPPPIPGQTANHGSNSTHKPEDQTQYSKNASASALSVAIPKDCNSEALKDDPDCKKAKDKESTVAVSKLPTANVTIERNAKRDIFDWIAYVGSLLLVVAGITGVFVGWRTLKWLRVQTVATKDAARAAFDQTQLIKGKERARLVVNVIRLETLTFGDDGNQIMMKFENIGATLAQNVTACGTTNVVIKDFDPSDLEPFDIGLQDVSPQDVIRSSQSPVETYLVFFLPERWGDDLAIMDRRILIEMRGSVEYEDIFGDRHSTPFNYDLRIPRILKWRNNRVAEVHPFSQWSPSSPSGNLTN